jgi:hypothetical protein
MPDKPLLALCVEISNETGNDVEDLEKRTVRLRDELLELDVDDVARVRTEPAPAGTKAADAYSAYSLVISLSDSVAIASVITLLQSWINRNKGVSATIQIGTDKLEVKDVSAAQLTKIVESMTGK